VHRLRVHRAVHDAAPADAAALRRALAAAELKFAAALRQIERMRRRDSQREREAVSLKAAVLKAERFAYEDELTGLPNRHALLDHFNLAAALAARSGEHVALLFIDLDGFKQVNDTFGHSVGDILLRQVALRLVGCVRASDTTCRYGGDEFAVLLPALDSKHGAVVVADTIRARLAVPFRIDGAEIAGTVSVGIAVYPDDASCYADLVSVSDRAMYLDKARHAIAVAACRCSAAAKARYAAAGPLC
jgi:diguanylate cyclase (GGDEF)-like protein